MAFDADYIRVWQASVGVDLEFDPFFEVRATRRAVAQEVLEGRAGDDCVQQARFPGTGFACDHRVLCGADAQFQRMHASHTTLSNRYLRRMGAVCLPSLFTGG